MICCDGMRSRLMILTHVQERAVKADDFDICVGTDCVIWFIPFVCSETECVLEQMCALYFNCNDIWVLRAGSYGTVGLTLVSPIPF
jgi:hypothetical protein